MKKKTFLFLADECIVCNMHETHQAPVKKVIPIIAMYKEQTVEPIERTANRCNRKNLIESCICFAFLSRQMNRFFSGVQCVCACVI